MAAAAILQSCEGSPSTLRFVFVFQPPQKTRKTIDFKLSKLVGSVLLKEIL